MGWFSSACSFVSSAVSSVASTVSRGVSAVYSAAKDVAGRAVGWMAEKAEGFVDGVKKAWETVKPYVQHIRATLKAAAAATAGIPWLSGALLALDKGLGALTAFENSPIAKKFSKLLIGPSNWLNAGMATKMRM